MWFSRVGRRVLLFVGARGGTSALDHPRARTEDARHLRRRTHHHGCDPCLLLGGGGEGERRRRTRSFVCNTRGGFASAPRVVGVLISGERKEASVVCALRRAVGARTFALSAAPSSTTRHSPTPTPSGDNAADALLPSSAATPVADHNHSPSLLQSVLFPLSTSQSPAHTQHTHTRLPDRSLPKLSDIHSSLPVTLPPFVSLTPSAKRNTGTRVRGQTWPAGETAPSVWPGALASARRSAPASVRETALVPPPFCLSTRAPANLPYILTSSLSMPVYFTPQARCTARTRRSSTR
jgi:hypothetical protein